MCQLTVIMHFRSGICQRGFDWSWNRLWLINIFIYWLRDVAYVACSVDGRWPEVHVVWDGWHPWQESARLVPPVRGDAPGGCAHRSQWSQGRQSQGQEIRRLCHVLREGQERWRRLGVPQVHWRWILHALPATHHQQRVSSLLHYSSIFSISIQR